MHACSLFPHMQATHYFSSNMKRAYSPFHLSGQLSAEHSEFFVESKSSFSSSL